MTFADLFPWALKIRCACGCGELREPFDKKGRPRQFVNGHAGRLPQALVQERTNDRARNYRAANRSLLAAKQRTRHKADPNRGKAQLRRWRQAHPEKVKLYALRKHHKRRGAEPNKEAMEYVRILLGDPCCYCGDRVERPEIDHIVPVVAGGTGGWENLTPACRKCNVAKSSKSLIQFMLERIQS